MMNKKGLIIIVSMLVLLAFTGCNASTKKESENTNTKDKSAQTQELKSFTAADLKKFDGQNGSPAYVAIDGKIYDVTNNKEWKAGKHKGLTAGNDLTEALKKSPHGASVLKKLPVVGNLAQ